MVTARRLVADAAGLAGAGWAAHALPATAILATWLARPPETDPFGLVRWRGPARGRKVAVTFDDGPSPDATEDTLDRLDALGMKATFFCLGEEAEAHPGLVKEMARRGHAVGSHGYRHDHHLWRGPRWIAGDLARARDVLSAAAGAPPRWYRPSYGQLSTPTLLQARRLGLETVLWSRWGREFVDHDPASVLDRLATGVVPGAILLLHDTDVSCPPGTAARTHGLLAPLAELLAARRLEPVTLDELVGGRR